MDILRGFSVRLFVAASLALLVYCVGYGLFRWQHVLVRHSYFSQSKHGLIVSAISPQAERGESALQSYKATIGPAANLLFHPLSVAEEQYWIRLENQGRPQRNNSCELEASTPFLDECGPEE